MSVIALGCIGGVLPDLLRLLRWIQDKTKSTVASPTIQPPTKVMVLLRVIGLLLQSALGGFAVYLLGAASSLQAVAIGFAGPEFLTRFLAAAVPKVEPASGAMPQAGVMNTLPHVSPFAATMRGLANWWR